jgi:tRNA threonylcarbamoyladenosine biosynthesis protein TsaB
MKILAVEFSSERRSVAVVENDRVLGEAFEIGGRTAIAIVDKALITAKIDREQIDCIAIGIGPGSYTGIRGAISLVQGWQLAREIKTIGISSIECIAAQAQRDKIFGQVTVIVDAQRQEFYVADYEITQSTVSSIKPLRITVPSEINPHATLIGPDKTKLFPQATQIFPEASMLGQLACRRTDFIPAEQLEPIYLREVSFKKVTPNNPAV